MSCLTSFSFGRAGGVVWRSAGVSLPSLGDSIKPLLYSRLPARRNALQLGWSVWVVVDSPVVHGVFWSEVGEGV